MMPHQSPMAEKVPSEGVDTVIQKSSRSSSHQSSRHRTRDKSRDRDKDREQAKDWPPEKLSDSHSPVSFLQTNPNAYQNCRAWRVTPNFAILMHPVYTLDWHLPHVLAPLRANPWSLCVSSYTSPPHPPVRPRPLTCTTSRCLIQPLLRADSQRAALTQESAHPSSRAVRQRTRSWRRAGTRRPWDDQRATPTQSKWA